LDGASIFNTSSTGKEQKMEIIENKAGAVLVFGLSGRLDATTSGQLEKLVIERVQGGANRLLFDLSNLQYISSAGLRVLAMALKQISAADGRMALCSLREPVKMVFDISGFSSHFQLAESPDKALNLLS
jgi:anti-sigma B factor antagonist